jgi:plasmid stabilization system protein ParE
MSYSYVLTSAAQLDYEESLLWYLERSETAALNFVAAVNDTIQLICNHPQRWRNSYKNFRELSLKKYPFAIIYIIEEDAKMVVITAIYHHKRIPNKRFRR